MADDYMPQVDMKKELPKMNDSQKYYVKKHEKLNFDRAQNVMYLRKKNRHLSWFLGALVIGIYSYTIYAVKQERFLDFDETPDDGKESS